MKKILICFAMVFVISAISYAKEKYEVKSGRIEYKVKNKTNENEINVTTDFDDYGRKSSIRIVSDVNVLTGIKEKNDITNIMIENKTYILNNLEKTYIIMEDDDSDESDEIEDENYKK